MNVVVMGECMMELSPLGEHSLNKQFAGDVFNTAVYLKRLAKIPMTVSLFTAVGEDTVSSEMLTQFTHHDLDTRFVQVSSNKTIGAYLINVSESGERSFTYWRNDSAAKRPFEYINDTCLDALISATDVFYFSGISLAILSEEQQTRLWLLLAQLKARGARVVFDSNYRLKLWSDEHLAQALFKKCFAISDIIFAGVEDLQWLYDFDKAALEEFMLAYSQAEIVIKDGANDVVCLLGQQRQCYEVTPVSKVVDTTAAGDSFNAGYLSVRLSGGTISQAVLAGNDIAARVIQHKGAIVDENSLQATPA